MSEAKKNLMFYLFGLVIITGLIIWGFTLKYSNPFPYLAGLFIIYLVKTAMAFKTFMKSRTLK